MREEITLDSDKSYKKLSKLVVNLKDENPPIYVIYNQALTLIENTIKIENIEIVNSSDKWTSLTPEKQAQIILNNIINNVSRTESILNYDCILPENYGTICITDQTRFTLKLGKTSYIINLAKFWDKIESLQEGRYKLLAALIALDNASFKLDLTEELKTFGFEEIITPSDYIPISNKNVVFVDDLPANCRLMKTAGFKDILADTPVAVKKKNLASQNTYMDALRKTIFSYQYKQIDNIIQEFKAGIQEYKTSRHSTLGFFSRHFDFTRGLNRANNYMDLLNKAENRFQRIVIMRALFASQDGKILKKTISKKLGFENSVAALKYFDNIITYKLNKKYDNKMDYEKALEDLNKKVIKKIIKSTNADKKNIDNNKSQKWFNSINQLFPSKSRKANFNNLDKKTDIFDIAKTYPTLDNNIKLGNTVLEFVKSICCYGSDNRDFKGTNKEEKFFELALTKENSITPQNDIFAKAKIAIDLRSGRCGEQTSLAACYLLSMKTTNFKIITTENHTFLALGLHEKSDLSKPDTVPEEAVIIDPWADRVYAAKEFYEKINDPNHSYLRGNLQISNWEAKNVRAKGIDNTDEISTIYKNLLNNAIESRRNATCFPDHLNLYNPSLEAYSSFKGYSNNEVNQIRAFVDLPNLISDKSEKSLSSNTISTQEALGNYFSLK